MCVLTGSVVNCLVPNAIYICVALTLLVVNASFMFSCCFMVQWTQMALRCCFRHAATLVYVVRKCNMLCACANYTKYWIWQCSKLAVMNYITRGFVKLLIIVHPHTFHQCIIWISKKIKCSIIWTYVAITEQIFHHQSVKELNVNLED